jgi:hypothetical protein
VALSDRGLTGTRPLASRARSLKSSDGARPWPARMMTSRRTEWAAGRQEDRMSRGRQTAGRLGVTRQGPGNAPRQPQQRPDEDAAQGEDRDPIPPSVQAEVDGAYQAGV